MSQRGKVESKWGKERGVKEERVRWISWKIKKKLHTTATCTTRKVNSGHKIT